MMGKFKLISGLVLALLLSTLTSCTLEPDYYWGEVSTLRNGEPWSGDIRESKRDGHFDVSAYNYTSPGISDENLYISRIPRTPFQS